MEMYVEEREREREERGVTEPLLTRRYCLDRREVIMISCAFRK